MPIYRVIVSQRERIVFEVEAESEEQAEEIYASDGFELPDLARIVGTDVVNVELAPPEE